MFLFKFSVCVGCLLLGLTEVYLIQSCLTALCKTLNTKLCGSTLCDLFISYIYLVSQWWNPISKGNLTVNKM